MKRRIYKDNLLIEEEKISNVKKRRNLVINNFNHRVSSLGTAHVATNTKLKLPSRCSHINYHKYQHNSTTQITKENYKYVREYKKQLLQNVTNLLNDLNIKFVIGHGLLIEFIRGNPIYHDDDIDIRFDINDNNKVMNIIDILNNKNNIYNLCVNDISCPVKRTKNIRIFYKFKFKLILFENKENIEEFLNLHIEVDLVSSNGESFIEYNINFNNIRKVIIYDVETYVPSVEDTHKVLRLEYGGKYMTPLSNLIL